MPLKPIGQTALKERDQGNLYLHVAIWAEGERIVGPKQFRLYSFQGQEQISQPFEYQLELRGNSDPEEGEVLKFEALMGQPVTVGINLPSSSDDGSERFQQAIGSGEAPEMALFNGIITRFAMGEPGVYQATMQPALFKLTLSNHYRVLHNCTIRDAIRQVLTEHNLMKVDFSALSQNSNPALNRKQDWLQAGESDYDFIQRLMGKAQLFYYFRHDGLHHTLVFANHAGYPSVFSDDRPMRYTGTQEEALGLEQEDLITQYRYQQSLTCSSVNAVFTTPQVASAECTVADYTSYHAEPQPVSIGESGGDGGRSKGALPFHLYRIYPYGGSDQEVSTHADEQARMAGTGATSLSGSSACPLFRVGHQFTLAEEQSAKVQPELVRPTLDGKDFVLTSVKHQVSLDGGYSNQFESSDLDNQTLVTPFALQNTHQGSIIARVVAHGAGKAPNDWRYYNKNAFSPNRFSVNDSTATPSRQTFEGVYVQFSTDRAKEDAVWVRLASHMQTVPEVGSLVIVSRSNDEGELPEVQSIVQNNGTLVVTPDDWTSNSHVGNSYSTSFSDSKGIRFPFSSSGAELDGAVAVVEQRYSDGSQLAEDKFSGQVFKDVSYNIGGSWSFSRAVGGRSDILSESQSIGCTYSKTDAGESCSWSTIDLAWSESTHKNVESYTTVSEKQYSKSTIKDTESVTHITGNSTSNNINDGKVDSTSIHNGAVSSMTTYNADLSSITTHKGGVFNNTTHNGSVTGISTHNGAVMNTSTHNGDVISNTTVTGSQISSSNVTSSVSNSTVGTSTSSSSAGQSTSSSTVGQSMNNSVVGQSTNSSVVGVSSNTSVVGASVSQSMEGSNDSMSMLGVESKLSLVGSTTGGHLVGSTDAMNMTGTNNSMNITGTDNSISLTGSGTQIVLDNNLKVIKDVDEMKAKIPGVKAEMISGIMAVL